MKENNMKTASTQANAVLKVLWKDRNPMQKAAGISIVGGLLTGLTGSGLLALGTLAGAPVFYNRTTEHKGQAKVGKTALAALMTLLVTATANGVGLGLSGRSTTDSSVSAPAPQPISLNKLSGSFANYPICDNNVPACQVSQENALNSIFASANNRLSSPGVTGFTMRVDNIEKNEDGTTWDVRGKVTWDEAGENATAATGVGVAMGLMNMMAGGTVIDGIGTAASIASPTYKNVGKCLTSTSLSDVPKTEISVYVNKVSISNLTGVEEGSFITVSGTSILPFKPNQGLFGDRASSFYTPTDDGYGGIVVEGQGGNATFAGQKVATKEFCRAK